jgi:hypothetical protein
MSTKKIATNTLNKIRNTLSGLTGTARHTLGVDGSFTVNQERVFVAVYILALVLSLYKRRTSAIFVNIACVAVVAVLSGSIAIALLLGIVLFVVDYFVNLQDPLESFENPEEEEEETTEATEATEAFESKKPARKAKKAAKAVLPDNGERAEFLELGKKYKLPSENDDKDFHLDAGSTFMNAYKSLKPDQLAAMTKDTQDLMQTQKQLMSTLQTLKPLIMDGKEMMNTFQSYFGSGSPTMA